MVLMLMEKLRNWIAVAKAGGNWTNAPFPLRVTYEPLS